MPIKIQKTNRIRLKNTTIYCSCDIVREIRQYVERLHQVLAPKRGKTDELFYQLCVLANTPKWKDHFPNSTREWLARGVI